MESSDKAARAYASIASQLAQWDDGYGDDDVEMNVVSKRQSGAFSPMAMARTTNTTMAVSDSPAETKAATAATPFSARSRSRSARTPMPSSAYDGNGYGSGSGISSAVRFQKASASPMATPAGIFHAQTPMSINENDNDNESINVNFNATQPIHSSMKPKSKSKSTSGTEKVSSSLSQSQSPNAVNEASLHLDANYRPYHDALLSLLSSSASPSTSTSIPVSKDRTRKAQLQYMERIMTSAYARSSNLGDTLYEHKNRIADSSSSNTGSSSNSKSGSALEQTKQQLEQEGHFWALLSKLLAEQQQQQQQQQDTNQGQVQGLVEAQDTHTHPDLLLYKAPTNINIERDTNSFIEKLVGNYGHLDPANMTILVQTCLEEGVGLDIFDEHELDTTMSMKSMYIPTIVQRRQIILDWIQTCHNRGISGLDIDDMCKSNSKSNSNKVMWKDTIERLDQAQHSFLSSAAGYESASSGERKVGEFHPDAPFLVHDNNKSNSSSGEMLPLYGNDNEREVELLRNCLLLIKAGRMSDALELCTLMGQPWRAAAWDGNAAHGYIDMGNGDDNDNADSGGAGMGMVTAMDEEKEGNWNVATIERTRTQVGNSARALWKRNMWEVSASISTMLQSHIIDGNRNINVNESIRYEAAITAILADDTQTASSNPIFNNWMDLVWVFYRGHQARFTELIFNAHNNARRCGKGDDNINVNVSKYPFEGTEFAKEEMDQLACTAEMSRVEEGAFLTRLIRSSTASASATHGMGEMNKCITAFLIGAQDVQQYLKSTMDALIRVAESDGSGPVGMSQEEYEPLVRFIVHLALFFDSFCIKDRTGAETSTSSFYSTGVAPRRNPLVLAYLQQLMEQKPLWEFTPLYASLLSEEELIGSCSEFWSTSIFEEKDRRMILRQAREHFEEGLDLLILRDIVRMTFHSDLETFCVDELDVVSWLGTERAMDNTSAFDATLESMIASNDVVKMHSIQWLCFHNEHYADALVCANMLIRNFLLSLPTQKEDELNDWTDNINLYTAKVFQSRFIPSDIENVAMASITDENTEDAEDHVTEYGALVQFLDAHNAFQNWKEFVEENSPLVSFARDTSFVESTVESNVAMNMEIMRYVKKKKKRAQQLVKLAEAAKDILMEVLQYDDGWLYIGGESYDSNGNALGMSELTGEASQRRIEMQLIRCKVIPVVVSLAFKVCHSTALWMDEFAKDVFDSFGDSAFEVLPRITDKDFFEDNGVINPFQASTWHQSSLLLANTVASIDTRIAESMSKDDLSAFMNCMAEAKVCLLVDRESTVIDDDL